MYYLVIIQNQNTQAVYAYSSIDTALSAFHSELAYRGEGRVSSTCVIVNELGEVIKTDYWIKESTETQCLT